MTPTANGATYPHDGPNRLAFPPRMVILGYYDGPTDGVIQFGEHGPVFQFTMPDEERQLGSRAGTREYHLRPLPADALDRLAAVISPYHAPSWPTWFPLWRFPSPEIEQSVSDATGAILAEAGPPAWRVNTADYWTFQTFQAGPLAAGQPV